MSVQIIILAAGHGKRMKSELPKALTPLKGKPFLLHLLDTTKKSNMCQDPIIVIGKNGDQVKNFLGNKYFYAVQEEQLGTGHAVMSAKNLAQSAQTVLVLYADHPLISAKTIKNIISTHNNNSAIITLATTIVPDFSDWRSAFLSFGRIIRDEKGNIIKIVENKDATDEEKKVTEVNPAYMCFNGEWLWKNLQNLKNNNIQNEYYLTDLISMAFNQKQKIMTVEIENKEALGVNTKEQLDLMESLF
jgi:bifunctional UDP-N-acetylglucosamine pyrophosphorylase/glucosamine-1-phosphate N-acetyltransferase